MIIALPGGTEEEEEEAESPPQAQEHDTGDSSHLSSPRTIDMLPLVSVVLTRPQEGWSTADMGAVKAAVEVGQRI
jgi:hypothetical protein